MSKASAMKKECENAFAALMRGGPQETRGAKRRIEKLWRTDHTTFQKAAPVALTYLEQFQRIDRPANQAAFVSGLSLFFLTLADEHFELLKNFVLRSIRHPHGHVREAVRHTADWLSISLTDRMHPFLYPAGKQLTPAQQIRQQQAITQYRVYVAEIERLLETYDVRDDHSVECIDKMQPSILKSLQLLWSDITRGNTAAVLHTPPPDVLARRAEIERELLGLLKETESDYTLGDIQEIIYHEEGTDAMTKILSMFDAGQDQRELQAMLDTLTDAWNYFPHRNLRGLSPAEKMLEYQQAGNQDKSNDHGQHPY